MAQIALGAAAGAFVASRMNRGALLLTAGLAYSLWKKGLKSPAKTSQASEVTDLTPTIEEPSAENDSTEEALTVPVLFAQEPKNEEPESSGLASPDIQIVPKIEPVTAPPHIAPFLTFPVIEEPTQQINPEIESAPQSKPPVFDLGSAEPEAVETIDKVSESQESSAWEELRAALAPTYPSAPTRTDLDVEAVKPQKDTPPQIPTSESVTFSEPPAILEAPPMIDLTVCQPSSPLIHSPITEGVDIPDEIQLPEVAEENVIIAEDFLLDQPKAPEPSESVNPPPKPITVIIPRQDIKFTAAVTSPPPVPDEATPNSLSAPVVIPRDVQAKKSFFDWLRG